ncbi:MAG: LemA family protein [Patescibacteria group bacterium]|nr:LemA family protein [Patescibacteria group bacterium]
MIILWIILGLGVLLVFFVIGAYNSLVKLKNLTQEAWSDIDVQLKRRYNLIPNLVNTVKGYAAHEKEVFQKVTEARARAMGAKNPEETAEAERGLSGALKTLFAVAENYPELKANENFLKLQEDLTDTENKIEAARRFYNGNVRDYNTRQEVFPYSIIAKTFGFTKQQFFQTENEEEREAPEVKF